MVHSQNIGGIGGQKHYSCGGGGVNTIEMWLCGGGGSDSGGRRGRKQYIY